MLYWTKRRLQNKNMRNAGTSIFHTSTIYDDDALYRNEIIS